MNNNARAILDALTELIETLWNVNENFVRVEMERMTN